ncbi:hypothetical protein CIJ84_12525, partial [Neisseria meningitidis]
MHFENEIEHKILVTYVIAKVSGYISTINVDIGQQVEPSKLLLSIVPEQTELVANLYIPLD